MINKLSAQLTLGLSLRVEATFENFHAAQNHEIVAGLKEIIIKKSALSDKDIYLCGCVSEGKTHLLQACCHYAQQNHLSSVYIPLECHETYTPEILTGLDSLDLVCLDDVHLIAGKDSWEEALFHLYNRLSISGTTLIMTAKDIPQRINITLPDLSSRLSWGRVYQLQTLSDPEKLTLLIERAHQRGIHMSEEVGRYIFTHYPRSMGTLFLVLDKLDKASLAAQRRLTIPFIKEVLQIN